MLPCMEKEGEKCGRWVPRRKRRGKVVGPTCHGGVRAAAVDEEGSERGCAAAAAVGSTHASLSGLGRGRANWEREVGDAGVIPMPRCTE
jgi:hypothetical protein